MIGPDPTIQVVNLFAGRPFQYSSPAKAETKELACTACARVFGSLSTVALPANSRVGRSSAAQSEVGVKVSEGNKQAKSLVIPMAENIHVFSRPSVCGNCENDLFGKANRLLVSCATHGVMMNDAINTFPAKSTTKYRKDYRPSTHLVDTLELDFDLFDKHTCVRARMALHSNSKHDNHTGEIVLDGVGLQLVRVVVDGRELRRDQYVVDEETLTLTGLPSAFVLETVVLVEPKANTCFEGLYRSGLMFLTQCEAEGFRRITYFLDRPDVMARYITTVRADRSRYPLLLSNGNLIDSGDDEEGRHWARWDDPSRKPSYLFALVAGDLHCFRDSFTTMSGRTIELRVYVEHHHADKCAHAMASLIKALRWDV